MATGEIILTVREKQLIEAISRGISNKEIAGELSISIKTVEKHRQTLYYKLAVDNPVDVVRIGLRMGLIEVIDFVSCKINHVKHKKPRNYNIK